MAQATAKQQEEAKQELRGLVVYHSRDGQEIRLSFETIRRYLVSGKPEYVTEPEMMMFMGTCKARGLDPFKRDCYLVKYTPNDTAATIVSIDYYRSRAKAQPDCRGWQNGIILGTRDDKGKTQLEYRPGSFMLGDEELLGGWFRAKPETWTEPYEWSVPLAPYIKKTRDGAITQFWTPEKQPLQIAKVAESQGLRRVWPDEFQNLFLEEEIDTARDVTPSTAAMQIPQPLDEKQKKEPKGKSEPTHGLEARLQWLITAPAGELESNDNYALRDLKALTQAEQAQICAAVTDRRRELSKEKA